MADELFRCLADIGRFAGLAKWNFLKACNVDL